MLTIEEGMTLLPHTMQSLRITSSEVTSGGLKKEGMSVFGIITDQMYSSVGKSKILGWVRLPVTNRVTLTERLDAVEYLLDPGKEHIISDLAQGLKAIKPMRAILKRMTDAKFKITDWSMLQQTLSAIIQLNSVFRQHRSLAALPFFRAMTTTDSRELGAMLRAITDTIDFAEYKSSGYFSVKYGVSPDLDQHTQFYAGLSDFLSTVTREEMNVYTSIESLSAVYLPCHGFYVCLPLHVEQLSYVSAQHAEIEWIFETPDYAYCKTPRMRELDTEVGDIHGIIRDKSNTLALKLSEFILEHSDTLLASIECVAAVDCICGLANIARERDWKRPVLVQDEGVLQIRNGRHPLGAVLHMFIFNH